MLRRTKNKRKWLQKILIYLFKFETDGLPINTHISVYYRLCLRVYMCVFTNNFLVRAKQKQCVCTTACVCEFVCVYVCVSVCVCVCVSVGLQTIFQYMQNRSDAFVLPLVSASLCLRVCVCVCVYVWVYKLVSSTCKIEAKRCCYLFSIIAR